LTVNHKPSQTSGHRRTTVTQDDGQYMLKINDDDDSNHTKVEAAAETAYKGHKTTSSGSYILRLDPEGSSLILDRLEADYAFNLVSAPWEKDSQKLATQYQQIAKGDVALNEDSAEDEGLFDDDISEPDPDNPFDYRHYLNGLPEIPGRARSVSAASTPVLAPTKPTTRTQLAANRSPAPQSKHAPKPRSARVPPPPQVRLERRASEKRPPPSASDDERASNNDDDDGGLEIDMGDGYQPKKKRAVDPARLLGRPISLRSAAASASPGYAYSPAPPEAGSGYEEDNEEDMTVEGGQEEDEVVEDDTPTSPMVLDEVLDEKSPSLSRKQSVWDADDEAELQAQLELQLANEMDEDEEVEEAVPVPAVAARQADSEEESEEE